MFLFGDPLKNKKSPGEFNAPGFIKMKMKEYKKYILFTAIIIALGFTGWKVFVKKPVLSKTGLYDSNINYVSNKGKSADNFIYALKEQLEKLGDNSALYVKLGSAYIQKARETFDPNYYSAAEDALEKAIKMDKNNSTAVSLLASVYLSRHDFKGALELGNKSLILDPANDYTYGILVDAQNELGMYDESVVSAQKMVDLKPNLSSYSRVSYIREIHGDISGAIDAMKLAVNAGSPKAENLAWVKVQLANLYYNKGDIDNAEHFYESSTDEVIDYVHGLGGLAKIALYKKDYIRAIKLYTEALSQSQMPEYLIALGDVFTITGQTDKANEQYDKVIFALTMLKNKGIETDIELAIFNADHNRNIENSLDKVEQSLSDGSKSFKAYHAAAWLYFKKGDYKKAEENINSALKLGTKDPLMIFHAGKIFEKNGENDKANEFISKALMINPHYQILYAGS
ncbi:hypothetical protein BH10BAC5_BH10BAC5_14730 [soil metagenome]